MVIIGAGVFGLTAAAALKAHGKEVVMVEARAIAGGRIFGSGSALKGLDGALDNTNDLYRRNRATSPTGASSALSAM